MHTFVFAAAVLASVSLASAQALCGVKGFDKTPAYNFLNDTVTGNFDGCTVRCGADTSCKSFGYGNGQCLLYAQDVATNVIVNEASPFSFYDRECNAEVLPSSSSSSAETSPTSSIAESASSSETEPASSSSIHYEYGSSSSTEHESSSATDEPTGSESASETHPTSTDTVAPTHPDTSSETHPPSPTETEDPEETITSYIDVTITSCEPQYTDCPGTPEHPDSSVDAGSSDYPGTVTVITTNYIAVCPTGYTTVPYTYTVTPTGGEYHPTGVPEGFTTTAPTVTITVPVVSVVPVETHPAPVAETHPAPVAETHPAPVAETHPAPAPPAGSVAPVGSNPAPAPVAPAGTQPAPAPPADTVAPVYSSETYPAGNSTATYLPSGTGSNPAEFTGAATRLVEGSLTVLVGAIMAAVVLA